MRGGANRLPKALKVLRGTLRKCRDIPNAPEVKAGKVPEPPKGFTRVERETWQLLATQVEALGTYSESDYSAFRLLVRAVSMADSIQPDMPATAAVRLLQVASGLLGRFGLDPASRDRVPTHRQPGPDDVAEELFGRPGLAGIRAKVHPIN